MSVPSSLPEPAYCRVRKESAVTDQSVGGGGGEYLGEDLHKGAKRKQSGRLEVAISSLIFFYH